jgi:hypothetical protein
MTQPGATGQTGSMDGRRRQRGALLVRDPSVLDLDAVRRLAASHDWEVVLERLDGSTPGERAPGAAWFPEAMRLRVVGVDVDAALLLVASAGLELDTERRLDA